MKNRLTANPKAFTELLSRGGKNLALLLVMMSCAYLFLSMAGYDPKDPGWSHLGYHPQVENWMGIMGAWVADLSFSFLGLSAWFIPFVVLFPCLRFMFRGDVSLLDGLPFVMLRTVGLLLLIVSCSGLASLHVSNVLLGFPFTSGGLIGQALSDWMVSWFSLLGSSLLLVTAAAIGSTFYMETSWGEVAECLGAVALKVYHWVLGLTTRAETPVEDELEPDQVRASMKERLKARFETPRSVSDFPAADEEMPLSPIKPIEPTFAEPILSALEPEASVDFRGVGEDEDIIPILEPVKDTTIIDSPEKRDIQDTASQMENAGDQSLEAAALKKSLKIVPLAETHRPLQNDDQEPATSERKPVRSLRKIPALELLDPPELQTDHGYSEEQLEEMSRLLESKLKDFGVVAEVVEVNPGPVITRFEIQPAPGVKASKITNLAKDLARSLAVSSVRVVEVIPGKSVMGIEIPNSSRQMVRLSEVLNSKPYKEASSKLTLGLGNDIAGNPVVTNLAKMPHLLVAGTTGSGKSVGVNAMLLSLLFKATPEEVRLMMVDPKMLELSIYEGIPHLLTPVITDMKEAAGGLRWCVGEMERRYRLMAKMGVRNLAGFNEKVKAAEQQGKPLLDPLWNAEEHGEPFGTPAPALETLPYIVVVIDEFADMMMIVGKKVEELIARIAQKARAAGIHLILATQRPSVDVITGLIKANVPTRIAFQVSSKIDSRTILDQSGAENLLGNGDMLYLPAGTSVPNRVHGAFVSDDEVHRVVEAWKAVGAPVYIDTLLDEGGSDASGGGGGLFDDEQDPLYDEAVAFVTETRKASISSVQRKLKIGYNRAARMVETMEAAGVVTEAGSNGQREVLAPPPVRG